MLLCGNYVDNSIILWYKVDVARSAMVTPMNEKPVRKPRNVLIDPEALYRTRVEALRSKKTLGEWLEEAIE